MNFFALVIFNSAVLVVAFLFMLYYPQIKAVQILGVLIIAIFTAIYIILGCYPRVKILQTTQYCGDNLIQNKIFVKTCVYLLNYKEMYDSTVITDYRDDSVSMSEVKNVKKMQMAKALELKAKIEKILKEEKRN